MLYTFMVRLIPRNLLFRDKPEQNNQVILEASCLFIVEFEFSGLINVLELQSYISPGPFDNISFSFKQKCFKSIFPSKF